MTDTDSLTTIRDMVRWAATRFNANELFFGHGTDNALDEALALVMYCLSLDYSLPDNYLDCHITATEKQTVINLIEQRITTRKPLAHLTGKTWFAGLEFNINEHVLVPRSPVAELISNGFYPWADPEQVHSILDMCTGSGCIGIATAVYLPETQVVLSDISEKALGVAQENITKHHLAERVQAVRSDVFDDIPAGGFDIIISNPPYVSEQEYRELPAEYLKEPKLGLTAEEDGMAIVARILAAADRFLNPEGVIIIEVGDSADLLMQRYPEIPFNWIDFEQGGDGVFVMTKDELRSYQAYFNLEKKP